MSKIIITGGTVLTINDADDVHFGGHVVLDGDRIAAVGEGPYPGPAGDGDQVIDASGKIVMPGLVDLHYHTAIAKGFSDHLPLWEYLDACWYPFIRTLDAEAAYWSAAASYLESIKCGVTTVNDMYRRLPDLGRAAHDIGIRAVLSNDVALPEHNLDTLQDNKDAYDAVHGLGDGRIEVYVGIEWLPLASPELLRDARALADELGTGIHIHLNESLTEVENSKERFGRRPDRGGLRRRAARPGLRRRALRLAVRHRDRADARDAHPDLAQPQLQRQARQRDRPAAGNAGRRAQRRASVTTPPSATTAGMRSRS